MGLKSTRMNLNPVQTEAHYREIQGGHFWVTRDKIGYEEAAALVSCLELLQMAPGDQVPSGISVG